MKVPAYAAPTAGAPLGPFTVERRDLRPDDVQIEILYCGSATPTSTRPATSGAARPSRWCPGHEIVGRVTRVGAAVKRFKVGDSPASAAWSTRAGSARLAVAGLEQFCEKGAA